jgi:SEC-C motif
MATPAQSAASRANSLQSTGAVTEEGRQASSQNAITFGLFTQNEYVRPGEEDEYARFGLAFRRDLNPEGAAEETLASLMVSASWRIRRCAQVEAGLAPAPDLDPMQDDSCSTLQASVDRARSRAFNLLHRAMADLRRLQTDKRIRFELSDEPDEIPDLTDYRAVTRALCDNATQILRAKKIRGLDTMKDLLDYTTTPPIQSGKSASFCNEAPAVPRNAPCPCGSDEKYKRCCGKDAPPVLSGGPGLSL